MQPDRASPGPDPPEESKVRIEVGRADSQRWDEYLAGRPDATLFHGSGWQRIIEATFGYPQLSCWAWRGDRVCGVLPLFLVPSLPFGRALISTPHAVYGGICADDPAAVQALSEHAKGLAERMGVRYLELRNSTPMAGLLTKDLYVTFRKDIHPDPDANLAWIPRNQRRSIRVGQKHGLRAAVGGQEMLESFFRIYAHSMRHLGTPVFPLRLFRNLFQEYGSSCRILAVYHEERMVSGVVTFFYRNQLLPYYGGARREAYRHAVNDFMYWSLLAYGAEHGFTVFDFGRSKKDSGSFHFKRHWGFSPTPLAYQYHLVRQRSMPDLSPRNPRFSLAIRAWKQMPDWLATQIGPRIVRYFP